MALVVNESNMHNIVDIIIGHVAGNTCEVNYDDVYKMMQ